MIQKVLSVKRAGVALDCDTSRSGTSNRGRVRNYRVVVVAASRDRQHLTALSFWALLLTLRQKHLRRRAGAASLNFHSYIGRMRISGGRCRFARNDVLFEPEGRHAMQRVASTIASTSICHYESDRYFLGPLI
jgi:hypothetical protein